MASSSMKSARRFAPLKLGATSRTNAPILRGIVFDVDGTMCEPQNYMFGEMRSALGIPKSVDILDHIYSLPDVEQSQAMNAVKRIESEAMAKQTPQGGLLELMEYLERRGVQKGICTRNFDTPVNHLLFTFLPNQLFSPIVTREFRPPKPNPAGILHIAERWGLEDRANSLIMVGDSIDDMTAGFRAGAATVLLVNQVNAHLASHEHTDLCIRRLDDLIGILEEGFLGHVGEAESEPDTKKQAEAVLNL